MKSPITIKLRNLADMELAYRRLRDDISAIELAYPDSQVTTALLSSMRRLLVQVVLADRYVGVYVDGSIEEAETIAYTPISTLAELHTLVKGNLKGKFQLTADIDATDDCLVGGDYYNGGEGWEPIGTIDGGEGGNADSGFQGIFDGNGFKITGIKCNRPTEDYQAFFGFIGTGGVVKNLEIADTILSGRSQMGGLCGGNAGLVYNCHVTGASTVSGNNTSLDYSGNIGGVVGDNDGTLRLCSAAGTITGLRDVGGVSGDNDGLLQNCWFLGDVYCSVVSDAGLISGDNKGFIDYIPMADMPITKGTIYGCYGVGTVQSFDIAEIGTPDPTGNIALGVGDSRGGKISASYAVGTVSGKNPDVAGFVGNNDLGDNSLGETIDSIISNCYCEATVTPIGNLPLEGAVGGFVGKNKGGQIYNCYSVSTVNGTDGVEREHIEGFCGNNSNDDLIGTISNCFFNKTLYVSVYGDEDGLSLGKTTSQLRQQATFEGWDFGSVWSIDEGLGYPSLPDMPEATIEGSNGPVEVFPIQIIGTNSLTGDVRPKVVPGHVIFATECEDGIVRTPIIVEDKNFPVGRGDITDGVVGKDQLGDLSGNDIAGEGLRWDVTENIRVNQGDGLSINDDDELVVDPGFGLDINEDGEVVVDPGEFNGVGLDIDGDGKLEVDLSEVPVTDLDFTDIVDEITIGFDNPKAYVAGKTYEEGEKVSYDGTNYVSIQDDNTGNTPDSSPLWWTSITDQKVLKIKEGVPGDGLQWSTNGKIEINHNATYLNINASNELTLEDKSIGEAKLSDTLESTTIHFNTSDQLSVVDDSIGRSKLGDDNGDTILGDGLDWDATNKIEVDLSEVPVTDLDFKHTSPHNNLLNADFERWSAGDALAPDNWTLYGVGASVAKEDALEKIGDYSAKLTSAVGASASLIQEIHEVRSIGYWSGRSVTFGAWVYATVANKVRLYIGDNVGDSFSSYHTGDSSWQWLSVTRDIDESATAVKAYLYVAANSVGYIDGAMLIEGSNDFAFYPHVLDVVRDALGDGLDYDETDNSITVDLSEVISIDGDTLDADTTDQTNNNWYTVLEKQVTAAEGTNLDIRLFMPVKSTDIGVGDKRGKFNVQLCIGTSIAVGSTIVEGRYELPDHGDQIPVVMSVIRKDITAADPYIRVQIKNDDYTINQTHIDCADKDGQFTIIVF